MLNEDLCIVLRYGYPFPMFLLSLLPSDRGVDDILPIMSYVIIRSALPQLVSETALMEEFIQDG